MRTLLLPILAAVAFAAGCTNYAYIVRRDNAPLYADEERSRIVGRMERLEDGYIGHSAPDSDPVKVRYRGQKAWADRQDLRIFHYPNDEHSEAHAVFQNRRVVIVEGKDWPKNLKDAIVASRVENGMTREMVELAWGQPTATRQLDGGAERWIYERRRYHVHEDVHYDWYPGGSSLYYGFGPFGPSWGYAYSFPSYEPRYYRTYYPYTERRTVTFSTAGTVTGWEKDRF
jgi:hypothetical protein